MAQSVMRGMILTGALLVISAAAGAGTSGASARLAIVSQWALEWGGWIILIGFLTGLAWFALNSVMGGLQRLVAIPVLLIIVGALVEAGPMILPASAGAELTQELRLDEVPQP